MGADAGEGQTQKWSVPWFSKRIEDRLLEKFIRKNYILGMNSIPENSVDTRWKRLVVIIPALNEAITIAGLIGRIPTEIERINEVLIVVVDDGSTDETSNQAVEAGAIVVQHPRNLGVGFAFRTGIEKALRLGADIIVNMDGDGQFRPEDIPTLVRPILDGRAGFVTCTRFSSEMETPKMPWIKLWGNKMMCRIVNSITRKKLSDVSCGFRAYSRETALRLNLFGRFTYTQESFIDLANKNVSMCEVPLVVRGEREHGKSRVASSLFRYALQTSMIILRALRDTKPLAFFGSLSGGFLTAGFLSFAAVGTWWLFTGRTSPWTSLLFVGTVLTIIGVGVGVLALIADQIGRGRQVQEQLLYFERRKFFDNGPHDSTSGPNSGFVSSQQTVSEPNDVETV